MAINCVIIEDEPLAQQKLVGYIAKLPSLNLSATFDNGIGALEYLKINPADLVFLDINLGVLSGIQILELGRLKCPVIITTAYEQYALKGYELNVTDYLLKPFTFERFVQAVTKVQQLTTTIDIKDPEFIFIKTAYRLEKLELNDILFIEGARDYRRIHTIGRELTTLQTFREFESNIPDRLICRVHRSYMVSIRKIEMIENEHIVIGNRLIPLSETYKKRFLEVVKQ
jgi:DNA-binding LytR/AlgR family response regulator